MKLYKYYILFSFILLGTSIVLTSCKDDDPEPVDNQQKDELVEDDNDNNISNDEEDETVNPPTLDLVTQASFDGFLDSSYVIEFDINAEGGFKSLRVTENGSTILDSLTNRVDYFLNPNYSTGDTISINASAIDSLNQESNKVTIQIYINEIIKEFDEEAQKVEGNVSFTIPDNSRVITLLDESSIRSNNSFTVYNEASGNLPIILLDDNNKVLGATFSEIIDSETTSEFLISNFNWLSLIELSRSEVIQQIKELETFKSLVDEVRKAQEVGNPILENKSVLGNLEELQSELLGVISNNRIARSFNGLINISSEGNKITIENDGKISVGYGLTIYNETNDVVIQDILTANEYKLPDLKELTNYLLSSDDNFIINKSKPVVISLEDGSYTIVLDSKTGLGLEYNLRSVVDMAYKAIIGSFKTETKIANCLKESTSIYYDVVLSDIVKGELVNNPITIWMNIWDHIQSNPTSIVFNECYGIKNAFMSAFLKGVGVVNITSNSTKLIFDWNAYPGEFTQCIDVQNSDIFDCDSNFSLSLVSNIINSEFSVGEEAEIVIVAQDFEGNPLQGYQIELSDGIDEPLILTTNENGIVNESYLISCNKTYPIEIVAKLLNSRKEIIQTNEFQIHLKQKKYLMDLNNYVDNQIVFEPQTLSIDYNITDRNVGNSIGTDEYFLLSLNGSSNRKEISSSGSIKWDINEDESSHFHLIEVSDCQDNIIFSQELKANYFNCSKEPRLRYSSSNIKHEFDFPIEYEIESYYGSEMIPYTSYEISSDVLLLQSNTVEIVDGKGLIIVEGIAEDWSCEKSKINISYCDNEFASTSLRFDYSTTPVGNPTITDITVSGDRASIFFDIDDIFFDCRSLYNWGFGNDKFEIYYTLIALDKNGNTIENEVYRYYPSVRVSNGYIYEKTLISKAFGTPQYYDRVISISGSVQLFAAHGSSEVTEFSFSF